MSKNATDLTPPTPPSARARGHSDPPVVAGRRAIPARRPATSVRLAREAQQQRLWYFGLFGVIGLSVLALLGGALWQYVIYPAQPVATVNNQAIRTDTFNRYQKFQQALLNNQSNQLLQEQAQLQANTKNAAANTQILQQLQQQQQTVSGNLQNVPAYTLSQMEQALELQQAAGKTGTQATPAQLDAQMTTLKKQAGYNSLISSTGVQDADVRTYFATPAVVQQNVTKHYQGTVLATQPQAKARHILVAAKDKALADNLATAIKSNNGATFGALAQRYSIDNGGVAPTPPTTTKGQTAQQKQQALTQYKQQLAQYKQGQKQTSAFNGGWLRDPSQPFVANQPSWLTSQTQFVPEVLNAILAMKPNEVRVVKSQYGYHVIQVTARGAHTLSKTERNTLLQQNGQKGYQTWFQTATDPAKNKISPSNPYAQFPAATPAGQ